MTTRILQWQRVALLASGIATSMASMAWSQELYQTHTDGSIWQSTGIPCSRGSCPGWIELDNNPHMYMIAAGGGALYEMHIDGSIWWYVGPACSGGSCPGWVELDNNKNAIAIGVGGSTPYEMHIDGSLWEFNGNICTGGSCPGWTELAGSEPMQLPPFGYFAGATGSLVVYETTSTKNGAYLFMFDAALDIWPQIDVGYPLPTAVGINTLYDMQEYPNVYSIRQYTGSPITYNWQTILESKYSSDGGPGIMAAGGGLYVQRPETDYATWQYTGTPCDGSKCPGWVKIDNHRFVSSMAAGSDTVYQIRNPSNGELSIWQYNGTPCTGNVCPGWVQLDNNPNTQSIVAGPVLFGYYNSAAGGRAILPAAGLQPALAP
ncbi:MAG: hypothetical protein ABSC93_18975 [Bryobacteraceae bacterium]|jgi:hypothetical protein